MDQEKTPQQSVPPGELEHLEQILRMVNEELEEAQRSVDKMDDEYKEAQQYIADSHGEGDPKEMFQTRMLMGQIDNRGASAVVYRDRLKKTKSSPYFARIDFAPQDEAESAAYYIGLYAFRFQQQLYVIDWRSPVASMFYDFELGPAFYDAPQGHTEGRLTLKRQFKIVNGEIEYAFDSSQNIQDDILQQELAHTSDEKMKSIISTIQKEQNQIIRNEKAKVLIIQGVAGSGKTSIALHRVAFLLYRFRNTIKAQNVTIISPNKVFGDYIAGVLPELGEEPVRQWSLHDLAALLLEGITKVALPVSAADEADPVRAARAAAKGTEAFAASLTAWLGAQLGEKGSGDGKVAASELFEPRDLAVGGDVAEASWLAERFAAYAPVPFDERLDLIAGDALELAHGKTFGRYVHTMPTRRELRGRLLRMMRAKNPLALYKRFLADTGQSALFKAPAKGVVEWEDAFPVVLCALAFAGPDGFAPTSAMRHLVIDEMQDLTPVQHEAISRLFRCDRTILGDVNQLVDGRAVSAPEAVAAHYPGARVVRLMTSYRSTSEITELAARVMPVAGLVAVQRHGEAVRFARCGDTVGVLAAVDEAIERWRASGRRTLGVIAKSDFLAARYAELIARDHDLTLLTDETDAYPGGIVVSSVRLAKGLEFDEAVLLDADGRQYATEADRNLLYVAVTRAMHALTVLYRDEPSPFLGEKRLR